MLTHIKLVHNAEEQKHINDVAFIVRTLAAHGHFVSASDAWKLWKMCSYRYNEAWVRLPDDSEVLYSYLSDFFTPTDIPVVPLEAPAGMRYMSVNEPAPLSVGALANYLAHGWMLVAVVPYDGQLLHYFRTRQ